MNIFKRNQKPQITKTFAITDKKTRCFVQNYTMTGTQEQIMSKVADFRADGYLVGNDTHKVTVDSGNTAKKQW